MKASFTNALYGKTDDNFSVGPISYISMNTYTEKRQHFIKYNLQTAEQKTAEKKNGH